MLLIQGTRVDNNWNRMLKEWPRKNWFLFLFLLVWEVRRIQELTAQDNQKGQIS